MSIKSNKWAIVPLLFCIFTTWIPCEGVQEQDIHFMDSQDVKRYHDNSKLQWDWAIDSLAKLPFAGDEQVLDIGCGDGKITAVIAEALPQGNITGLDISPEMISFASKSFPSETNSNLRFMVGDARKLPYNNQYDVVVSFTTMHFIGEQHKALQCIEQSLKPGGITLIVMPHQSWSHVYSYAGPLIQTEKWKEHFQGFVQSRRYFTAEEYRDLLQQAGLVPLQVQVIPYEQRFENQEAFENWLAPVSSHARHLPPELRPEFIHDLVGAMMQDSQIDHEGRIIRYSEKIEAWAKKK